MELASESSPGAGHSAVTGLVRDVVVDVIAAIGEEMSAAAKDERSAVQVRNGRPVGRVGAHQLWTFDFDGNLPVPAETPARLLVPDQPPLKVRVLAVGDLDLVLSIDDEAKAEAGADVGGGIARARLSVDPWFILEALRNRLEILREHGGDIPLTEALLDLDELDELDDPALPQAAGSRSPSELPLRLGDDQLRAASHAARAGLRFVWGPPGTGKTSTLAAAVALLASPQGSTGDHRPVLITAHANAAVDVAMSRIADAHSGTDLLADGRILRVGVPHLDIARSRHDILPDRIIAREKPTLVERRDTLVEEQRLLSRQLNAVRSTADGDRLAARLNAVLTELADIRAELRDAYVDLISRAVIVGVTLSKLVLDDLIWACPHAGVVVDEASMSGLPFLLAIALRGTSTLACFGDFRQLPPIAVSDDPGARLWFARDAFELAGVESRWEAGWPDPRLAILRTQYRMGTDISETVSSFAYRGLLQTHDTAAEQARTIAALPPLEDHEVVVVDTTALATTALKEMDPQSYSRVNLLSAGCVTSLVHDLVGAGAESAGVVTPYRAQARLLQALLRGTRQTMVATAHRFQGSERDAMVLDLTDAAPYEGPSILTGRDPDLARRLLNVSISRARGKLVLVADLGFLRDQHPLSSPARALLEAALDVGGATTVDAVDLVTRGSAHDDVTWWPTWDAAMCALANEGWPGEKHVDVSLADEDHAGPWLDALATASAEGTTRVSLRAPVPIAVRLESTPADISLRPLGPGPLAFVGNEIMVVGSRRGGGPAARISSGYGVVAARRLVAE